jgi:hypothetical protein
VCHFLLQEEVIKVSREDDSAFVYKEEVTKVNMVKLG